MSSRRCSEATPRREPSPGPEGHPFPKGEGLSAVGRNQEPHSPRESPKGWEGEGRGGIAARRTAAALATLLLAVTGDAAAQAKKPASPSVPNQRVTGTGIAVEGDLLTVGGRAVRLMGIDAPDPGQTCRNRYDREFDCFAIATSVLKALLEAGEADCIVADRDRNGQEQGECRVLGVDLGNAMVVRGWAFAYRSLSPAYQQGEAYAMSRRLGLWSGKVEKPWQWRSRKLLERR